MPSEKAVAAGILVLLSIQGMFAAIAVYSVYGGVTGAPALSTAITVGSAVVFVALGLLIYAIARVSGLEPRGESTDAN